MNPPVAPARASCLAPEGSSLLSHNIFQVDNLLYLLGKRAALCAQPDVPDLLLFPCPVDRALAVFVYCKR